MGDRTHLSVDVVLAHALCESGELAFKCSLAADLAKPARLACNHLDRDRQNKKQSTRRISNIHKAPGNTVFSTVVARMRIVGLRRFANFAAKASPAFGKFYRFSDSTPIDVSSSNVINGSTPPMPFDKFVDMKISRGCRNYYLPFWWLSRQIRSSRVARIPLQPRLVRKHSARKCRKEQPNHSCPSLGRNVQKTTRFSQAPRSVLVSIWSFVLV